MTQETALATLKMGCNVFLTGEPGAGKSYTVNTFVAYLRAHGVSVAVTASTGIAATHIGGMTIHSWSGIGIAKFLSKAELAEMATRDKLARRMRDTRVLIIDEISMLDGRTLTLVDEVCRTVRKTPLPFGGMQVVFVGDFFQLPPVTRDGEHVQFAFDSLAWSNAKLTVCYLSEQYRQEDPEFLGVLSALRTGEISEDHIALLNERRATIAGDMTRLFSHNADVDRMNDGELAKLPGKATAFAMRHHGARALVEQIMRGCLSPERLVLKPGAKVMFTKNNPEFGFVNGTTGTVQDVHKETGFPLVQLRSGRTILVEPMDWSIVVDGSPIASIVQLPLRLAWAITVHKSQGMSLDAAFIDLSSAFAYGQGYVALSRVRSLSGLHLGGLNERALQVDPVVTARDAEFRDASLGQESVMAATSDDELQRRHSQYLLTAGGTLEVKSEKEKVKSDAKETKASRLAKTLALTLAGMSIAAVAKERGRATGTIVEHLEQLHAAKKLPTDRLGHLFPDVAALAEIHDAITRLGFGKMKPVHEALEGRYPYETLRLAYLLHPSSTTPAGDNVHRGSQVVRKHEGSVRGRSLEG